MTASTHEVSPARPSRFASLSTPAALVVAVVSAVVGATIVNVVIAAIAHAAGASHGFRPLQFATFTGLTVLGIVVGSLVWTIVRARSANPAALLRRLVPIVIVLSFVPDIIVGASKSQPHTTWGAVIALMIMHVNVAGVALTALSALLPVRRGATQSS